MDPAQSVPADGELPGIVAQHHGVVQKAMRVDAAPLSSLGGNLHRVLDDCQTSLWQWGDRKPVQMRLPCRLINKARLASSARRAIKGPGSPRLRR
jgi:hypothetical protein